MTTALVQFQRPNVRDKLEATVGRVKSVTELLDDIGAALEKVEGSRELAKVLVDVLPWVADVGDAAAEAFPVVKFVVKLLGKRLAQPDPHVLAYLACTLAYQRSIEQALLKVGLPAGAARPDEIKRDMKEAYKALDTRVRRRADARAPPRDPEQLCREPEGAAVARVHARALRAAARAPSSRCDR